MAQENGKKKRSYLGDIGTGSVVREYAGTVLVVTLAGASLGYMSRGFVAKQLGLGPESARFVATAGGALCGFAIATVVVSEIEAAIIRNALEAEREILGTTRESFDAMSADQRGLHLEKFAVELGIDLAGFETSFEKAAQPAPQPQPVAPQPAQQPQQTAPAPTPAPVQAMTPDQMSGLWAALPVEVRDALAGAHLAAKAKDAKAAKQQVQA